MDGYVKAFVLAADECDVVVVDQSRLNLLMAQFYGATEYEYERGIVDVYGANGYIGSFEAKDPQFTSEPDGSVAVWLPPLL